MDITKKNFGKKEAGPRHGVDVLIQAHAFNFGQSLM